MCVRVCVCVCCVMPVYQFCLHPKCTNSMFILNCLTHKFMINECTNLPYIGGVCARVVYMCTCVCVCVLILYVLCVPINNIIHVKLYTKMCLYTTCVHVC